MKYNVETLLKEVCSKKRIHLRYSEHRDEWDIQEQGMWGYIDGRCYSNHNLLELLLTYKNKNIVVD